MTLVELLAVIAIVALAAALAVPNLAEFRRTEDLHRLARQVAGDAMRCRQAALTCQRPVGLVFATRSGEWFYTMVEDRDGDGVSRQDYERAVDRGLGPRMWLEFLSAGARVGVPDWRVPDPSGRGTLAPDDGLRIGNAAILSFTPQAHATPGTVYVNDGRERVIAVRIAGRDGRIRMLEWRRGWPAWRDVPPQRR